MKFKYFNLFYTMLEQLFLIKIALCSKNVISLWSEKSIICSLIVLVYSNPEYKPSKI